MAKEQYLQIRLDEDSRERIRRAAESEHLQLSTWARRVILKELDRLDTVEARRHRAARPEPGESREIRRVAEPSARAPKRHR